MHADALTHLGARERAERLDTLLEEILLAIDDDIGDASDRLPPLVDVVDEELGACDVLADVLPLVVRHRWCGRAGASRGLKLSDKLAIDRVHAQRETARFDDLDLEVAAGNRIAQMLKLPDGYTALVTSGAAAAMQSGLAGILTGDNEAFIRQIPDLTGMKSEVIIQKTHRNPFDHQLRTTGIKLVEVETREQLRRAVNERTAIMHFSNFANAAGQIKVDEWVKLAKEYKIPCMNDAAADTPPVSHLWDYANMGYDLITFSGGKAIRGPQCAGLLIGRKELVACALLNNSPHEDTLGRSQKVGKEEIIGMVKALEMYLNEDHNALEKEWQNRLQLVSREITKVPGVRTEFFTPDIANHVPHMRIIWDEARVKITPKEVSKTLRSSKPSIVIGGGEGHPGLGMSSFMLQPGEAEIIAQQLARVLKEHSS